jgi:addiction module RelE/StbE family toxin
MWTVLEESKVAKQLDKAPKDVQEAYEFWKAVAQAEGPIGLRNVSGFREHTLSGQWKGARTSYLNKQWRVVYVVQSTQLTILVLEVNPHDYRQKR